MCVVCLHKCYPKHSCASYTQDACRKACGWINLLLFSSAGCWESLDPEIYCEMHVLQEAVTLLCWWQHVSEYDIASNAHILISQAWCVS